MIISTDTKDRIAGFICGNDYFDAPTPSEQLEGEYSLNIQHASEILGNKDVADRMRSISNNQYGVLCEQSHLVINKPICPHRLLPIFMTYIVSMTMVMCGYKHCYGEATHPFSIALYRNHTAGRIIADIDYSNYVFNDGTDISYYFNRLKTNRNYTDKMVGKLKKKCKVLVIVMDDAKKDTAMIEKLIDNIIKTMSSKL